MSYRARKTGRRYEYEAPAPYFQFPLELIGSVALAALSLGARRVLDRLIIEHLGNAGKHNGKLAVSYVQLAAHAGVQKKEIAAALAELVDLGLIVIAHGRRPKGVAKTRPNFYRLTFLPDHEGVWPSEEWRRFEPSEGAGPIAWRAALVRAKDIAHAARKRRVGGKRPFRAMRRRTRRSSPRRSCSNAWARISASATQATSRPEPRSTKSTAAEAISSGVWIIPLTGVWIIPQRRPQRVWIIPQPPGVWIIPHLLHLRYM